MKRVASELDILSGPKKEPMREFFILQGVRFAFRVHQVILALLFHLFMLMNDDNFKTWLEKLQCGWPETLKTKKLNNSVELFSVSRRL